MVGKNDMMQKAQQRAGRVAFRQMRHAMAAAQAADVEAAVSVPIEQIKVGESIQVRVAGLNMDKVAEYAVVMHEAEGYGEFPPVDLFRDEDGALWVGDGHHRLEAAIQAGLTEVQAIIRPGGFDAAVEFAEEANLRHGLALTTRDKRNIYERRVRRGHEWVSLSDGAIARALGVDRKTVGNWRRQLEVTGEISPVDGPKVGADGKVREVSNVQEANRRRAMRLSEIEALIVAYLREQGGRVAYSAMYEAVAAQIGDTDPRYVNQAALRLERRRQAFLEQTADGEQMFVLAESARAVSSERRQQRAQAPQSEHPYVRSMVVEALEGAGGEVTFNALMETMQAKNIRAEYAEEALKELVRDGVVDFVGRGEEIVVLLVGQRQDRRQPVRYVGGEFNQDAGDEAVYGVPVVEEEAPAQGSAEDFRALVEMYKGWITEILGKGAAKYATLMQNIVGSDGETEQVNAFIAAIGELTRAKKVINDNGYYRMARGYTPVLPSAPQAERVDEEVFDEADGEATLLRTLSQFVDLSVELGALLENVRTGHIVITPASEKKVRALAEDALDFIHGYETPKGKQIVGLAALLVALLGELEGSGDGA